MKITDAEIIRSGEQDLIDAITGDLDWSAIENIFQRNHKLEIGEDVEYKTGDIVVHNNQVAYRLEFDVKVNLSVLLDRGGNYVTVTGSGHVYETNEKGLLEEPEKKLSPGHSTESEVYEKTPDEIDRPEHKQLSDLIMPDLPSGDTQEQETIS